MGWRWINESEVYFGVATVAHLRPPPPRPLLAGAAPPSPQQAWVTGGPVTSVSGPYAPERPLVAYAVTSAAQQQQAQSGGGGGLLALQECALAPAAPGGPAVVALTLESEGCGTGTGGGSAQPFGSGAVLRAPGWIAPSAPASSTAALGWAGLLRSSPRPT